jgi:hypothetical protein
MSSAYDPYRQLPGRPNVDTKLPAPPPDAAFHAPLPPSKFANSGYPQNEPGYGASRQPLAPLSLEPPQVSLGNGMLRRHLVRLTAIDNLRSSYEHADHTDDTGRAFSYYRGKIEEV